MFIFKVDNFLIHIYMVKEVSQSSYSTYSSLHIVIVCGYVCVVRTRKMRTGPLYHPKCPSAFGCSLALQIGRVRIMCIWSVLQTWFMKENIGLLVLITRGSIVPLTKKRRIWELLFKGPSHLVFCTSRTCFIMWFFSALEKSWKQKLDVWEKHRLKNEVVSIGKSASSFSEEIYNVSSGWAGFSLLTAIAAAPRAWFSIR